LAFYKKLFHDTKFYVVAENLRGKTNTYFYMNYAAALKSWTSKKKNPVRLYNQKMQTLKSLGKMKDKKIN
jgi:hypothetical protein